MKEEFIKIVTTTASNMNSNILGIALLIACTVSIMSMAKCERESNISNDRRRASGEIANQKRITTIDSLEIVTGISN